MDAKLAHYLLPVLAAYLIHSTLLIGGVWLVLRRVKSRRPAFREAAWKLAMTLPLATAPLQVVVGVQPWGGVWEVDCDRPTSAYLAESARGPQFRNAAQRTAQLDSMLEDLAHAARSAQSDKSHGNSHERVNLADDGLVAAGSASSNPLAGDELSGLRLAADRASSPTAPFAAWLNGIVMVWLVGAAVALSRLLWSWWRLHSFGRMNSLETGPRRRALDELLAKAKIVRHVRLLRTAAAMSPVAWGVWSWHIVVPDVLLRRLGRRELSALLAHELAHLARGDTGWLWWSGLIGAVGFFQPLNRLAARQIRKEAEFSSDGWAAAQTGDRIALARCLTMVAEIVSKSRAGFAAAAVSRESTLVERIGRLVAHQPLDASPSMPTLRAALSGVALALVIALVSLPPSIRMAIGSPESSPDETVSIASQLPGDQALGANPLAESPERVPSDIPGATRPVNPIELLADEFRLLESEVKELKELAGSQRLPADRNRFKKLQARVAAAQSRFMKLKRLLNDPDTSPAP